MEAGQGGEDGLEQPDGGDGQLHAHPGATGKQSWSAHFSTSQWLSTCSGTWGQLLPIPGSEGDEGFLVLVFS